MRTIGIDLASQPKDTASCVIGWRDDGATVEMPKLGVTDDDILNLIRGADVAGIDAPFGWPATEVEATYQWSMHGRWDHPPTTELRFRLTDHYVRELTDRPR